MFLSKKMITGYYKILFVDPRLGLSIVGQFGGAIQLRIRRLHFTPTKPGLMRQNPPSQSLLKFALIYFF